MCISFLLRCKNFFFTRFQGRWRPAPVHKTLHPTWFIQTHAIAWNVLRHIIHCATSPFNITERRKQSRTHCSFFCTSHLPLDKLPVQLQELQFGSLNLLWRKRGYSGTPVERAFGGSWRAVQCRRIRRASLALRQRAVVWSATIHSIQPAKFRMSCRTRCP